MTNNYFTPTPAHDRNVSTRLAAAYTAAGITPPSSFATALKRHLLTVPDVKREAATIASAAYTADPGTDVHEFWTNAVDQVIRAQGADALKNALSSALDVQERAAGARQISRALADLKPWAERQCKALTTAAKALPAGAAALDPEAVLALDAGKHLTTTRDALRNLALVASIPGTAARYVGTLGYYSHVMALVDPGNPAVEMLAGLGRPVNESKLGNTNAIRKLAQDVKTNPDLALVDVARGTYTGVTLTPAASDTDLTDRAARAGNAFTTRTATEAEQRHLIAMR